MSKVEFHVILRRKIKNSIDKILRYFSPNPTAEEIYKNEIKKIFIVRINYRIGNMLFVTPILKQIESEFPNAQIDILTGAQFGKYIFSGFKNIDNIYDFPRKLLKNPLELIKYIKKIRNNRYDIVINLNSGSGSDRLATLLAKAKYKLSFCDKEIFTPVNRCIKRGDLHIEHEALKTLELLKIFNIKPNYNLKLTIELSDAEKKDAKEELKKLTNSNKVFGIFRDARYEKKFTNEFWINLISEIQKQDEEITFIDILSPDIKEPLTDTIITYKEKNLRKVASFMYNLDAFICGDTGPMHLASASGVPTIALFKTTSPKLYGTLKENDLSLEINGLNEYSISKKILQFINKSK